MSLKTNNLHSPNQKPELKTDELYIINNSTEEFKTTYLDDNNQTVEVIFAPLETKSFPHAVGQVVLKHLVDFILNQGGFAYKSDINIEKEEIRKKCVVYE